MSDDHSRDYRDASTRLAKSRVAWDRIKDKAKRAVQEFEWPDQAKFIPEDWPSADAILTGLKDIADAKDAEKVAWEAMPDWLRSQTKRGR